MECYSEMLTLISMAQTVTHALSDQIADRPKVQEVFAWRIQEIANQLHMTLYNRQLHPSPISVRFDPHAPVTPLSIPVPPCSHPIPTFHDMN